MSRRMISQQDFATSHNRTDKMACKLSVLILTIIWVFVLSLNYSGATATNTTSSTIKSLQVANSSRSSAVEANEARIGSDVNKSELSHFGNQPDSSIFKPSFFKGLLSDRRRPSLGGHKHAKEEEGEEEEEVTKTIVMPINEPVLAGEEGDVQPETLSSNSIRKNQLLRAAAQMQHRQQHYNHQPKAEESLQLTSTEMNNILNDREAPDFYRERERIGDGVFVGEEQNRLWTSASNGFNGMEGSPHLAGSGLLGPSMDGNSEFMNHRLTHAASEAGFNHRFGSAFNADSELAGYPNSAGRLMQSPNEYNEYQAGNEYSNGMTGYGQGPVDYPQQSGLLRAGSGEMGPESGYMGSGLTGGGGQSGYGLFSAGGYPNSPVLDRHASELYGGGEGGYGAAGGSHLGVGAGEFSGIHNSRLLSAGSHIPNHNSFSGSGLGQSPFGISNDEYASRFGQAGSIPFDQRGFANSNNIMLRGNSMQEGTSSMPGNDFKRGPSEGSGLKLLPLSPVVPVPDDSMSANQGSYREASNNVEKDTKLNSYQDHRNPESQPQIHESLDDDATEQGDDTEENSANNNDESDDDNSTRASSVRGSRGVAGGGGTSLVLNFPPPNTDNSVIQPMIDFARVGSAGYLGPQMRHTNREAANNQRNSYSTVRQRFVRKNGRTRAQEETDPVENPAHIGKYIID